MMKKLVLGALVALSLAGGALANNGVLFSKPDDPTYETPTEALARQKGQWTHGRANTPAAIPALETRLPLAVLNGRADQMLIDRMSRETTGGQ